MWKRRFSGVNSLTIAQGKTQAKKMPGLMPGVEDLLFESPVLQHRLNRGCLAAPGFIEFLQIFAIAA